MPSGDPPPRPEYGVGDLYTVPASGGVPALIVADPDWSPCADWSPDGTRIAFLAFRVTEPYWEIRIVDPTGGGMTTLASFEDANTHRIAWSPDGTRLAFELEPSGTLERALWMINIDGTGLTKVSEAPTRQYDVIRHHDWR